MPDGREPVTIQVAPRIAELPAAEWDACAGAENPFVGHAFLAALEESGSAGAKTGWLPQHLAIAGDDGRLIGCMPLYLKSHSYGEYVFDWSWAEAYERAGDTSMVVEVSLTRPCAANCISHGMDPPDLYPFALAPTGRREAMLRPQPRSWE